MHSKAAQPIEHSPEECYCAVSLTILGRHRVTSLSLLSEAANRWTFERDMPAAKTWASSPE